MIVTGTIRTAGFRAMCGELARMSGKEYRDVLAIQAASAMKRAAKTSKIASKSKIERQVEERMRGGWQTSLGEWSVNRDTAVGRTWFWDKDRGVDRGIRAHGPLLPGRKRQIVQHGGFYLVYDTGGSRGHHVPDAIWGDYLQSRELLKAQIKERKKELVRRRGMERLSWLQIGDALGVPLASVAPNNFALQENIARGATVRGRTFANGTAFESTAGLRFQITVENRSPVALKRNGEARLQKSVDAGVKAFEIAMRKGVFDNLAERAKRYPGIFVKPA